MISNRSSNRTLGCVAALLGVICMAPDALADGRRHSAPRPSYHRAANYRPAYHRPAYQHRPVYRRPAYHGCGSPRYGYYHRSYYVNRCYAPSTYVVAEPAYVTYPYDGYVEAAPAYYRTAPVYASAYVARPYPAVIHYDRPRGVSFSYYGGCHGRHFGFGFRY
jgi:hypothetical protein